MCIRDRDAARLASRIVVMRDSHVFMDGTPPEIFSRAGELLEAGLDVPQITRVFLKLREMGAPVREGVYTVEQMCIRDRAKEQED